MKPCNMKSLLVPLKSSSAEEGKVVVEDAEVENDDDEVGGAESSEMSR